MATIFYWPTTGAIYGVHPDRNITVPDGVAALEVAAAPHEIAWPSPDGTTPGREQWSRVADGVLALRDDLPPDVRGFELDIKQAIGRGRLHALNRAYPLALWSLRAGDFASVKADVDDARATAVITADECGVIYAKAQGRRVPGF